MAFSGVSMESTHLTLLSFCHPEILPAAAQGPLPPEHVPCRMALRDCVGSADEDIKLKAMVGRCGGEHTLGATLREKTWELLQAAL